MTYEEESRCSRISLSGNLRIFRFSLNTPDHGHHFAHDEVCVQTNERVWDQNDRQHESHHDWRHRDVRRLSADSGRKNQIPAVLKFKSSRFRAVVTVLMQINPTHLR